MAIDALNSAPCGMHIWQEGRDEFVVISGYDFFVIGKGGEW
jgi:hypothetical protein